MSETKTRAEEALRELEWANELMKSEQSSILTRRERAWTGLRAVGVLAASAGLVVAGHFLNGGHIGSILHPSSAIGVFCLSAIGALASMSTSEVGSLFRGGRSGQAAGRLLGRRLRWTGPGAGIITAGMGAAWAVAALTDLSEIGMGVAVVVSAILYSALVVLFGVAAEASATQRRPSEPRDGLAIGLAVGVVFTPLLAASGFAAVLEGNWLIGYWLAPWQYCILSAGMLAPLAFDRWRGDSASWAARLGYMALGLAPATVIATTLGIVRALAVLESDVFQRLAISVIPAVIATMLYMGLRVVATRLNPDEAILKEQNHGPLMLTAAGAIFGLYLVVALVFVALGMAPP